MPTSKGRWKIGLELGGQLAFDGTLRGKLASPDIDGRVSLGSVIVNGNDLGALSATIVMSADELRIPDGRLAEKDGGGMQFTLVAPRKGEDNIKVNATLDRVNAAALIAALPSRTIRAQLGDTQSDVSGQVQITGIPNAMSGSAELRFGPGRLAGEPLQSLLAHATFSGSDVKFENIDAHLVAGHIIANGTYNTKTSVFDLQGRAENAQLSRLGALANRPGLPALTGTADFTAHVVGSLADEDFSGYQLPLTNGKDVTVNGRTAGTLALVGRTQNQQLSITLTTGLLGQPQVIAAKVNLGDPKLGSSLETTFNDADLTTLMGMILPQSTVTITGRATGTIKASGNLVDEDSEFSSAGLQGTANVTELTFRVEDVQLTATSPLLVQFSPSEVFFEKTQFTGPGTNILLGGRLAVGPEGRQTFTADGQLNLRVLTGLPPDVFTSGVADVAVRVTGSYENPRLNGTASVAAGSVSVLLGNERWTISNRKSVVRFTANQAQIESLTGTMGGGHVTASGGARLEGFALAEFLVNVHGENVTVPFPTDFRSTVDADLEIKGSAREQLVGGMVTLRRTNTPRTSNWPT